MNDTKRVSKKELDVRNLSKFSTKEVSKGKQLTHCLSKLTDKNKSRTQTGIICSGSVFFDQKFFCQI